MINTSTTQIRFPERADGGPRDPNPWRRGERLQRAGLAVERRGLLSHHVVEHRGGVVGERRTARAAELLAHRLADRREA
jgi:hypothetical protein